MIIDLPYLNLKKLKGYADWQLLLFLLLFLDVKLVVKIAAIIIIYLLQFDFRFGFKSKGSRLPLFYPIIISIAVVNYFIGKNYTSFNYIIVLLTGVGFWLLCILAIHQIKLSVERSSAEQIHRTLIIFLVANAVFSLLNLAIIIWHTHAINPYTYQGLNQKYFIGTGDYVKGITFDTSTTNAVLNAFGVFYFLVKKNSFMVLLCMAILLLTGSNCLNICTVLLLIGYFILKSSRDQKSIIVVCLVFLVVFMAKVSPQNNIYAAETIKNTLNQNKITKRAPIRTVTVTIRTPDSLLNPEEKKQKIAMLYLDSIATDNRNKYKRPINALDKNIDVTTTGRIYVPKPDINSAPYQNLAITPPAQKILVQFASTHKTELPISGEKKPLPVLPGKLISMLQTVNFFKQHPIKLFMGDGVGNFSSKLAFKASGLGLSGGYPAKYTYINHDFLVNHLDLYLNFFSKRASFHSLTNSPFSVYDQLFAEYGILGFIIFCVFYWGFFAKNYRLLTYGIPILLLTTAILFIDYWFEQLSVLVFFELLVLLDIKESSARNNLSYE